MGYTAKTEWRGVGKQAVTGHPASLFFPSTLFPALSPSLRKRARNTQENDSALQQESKAKSLILYLYISANVVTKSRRIYMLGALF